jgi:hypothetical protein
MAVTVTFNGQSYSIPTTNDRNWGTNVSNYLQAIAQGALQKTGGSFTLTADVNFGSTYGLVSNYFKSRTSNIATSGVLRLAKTDSIAWRNNANSANLLLGIDGSDQLTFNGSTFIAGAISALTGDVTATGPGSAAATVAAIQGTTVSGTTGTGNVVFSASPTFTGTLTAPLVNGGSATGSTLTLQSTSASGTSDGIIFKTGAQTTVMTINTIGNIGINRAPVNNVRVAINTATTGNSAIDCYDAGTRRFRLIMASDVELQADGAIPMLFYTNSSERLRITSGGNILIGNTSGTSLLSVGSAAQFTVDSTGNVVGTSFSGPLTGNVTGNVSGSAATFTGSLSGDVTSTGMVTSIDSTVVTGKVLTGYVSGAGTVAATDTILQAIQKLNGNISALTTGVSSVFGRTGAVVAVSGDYTVSQVTGAAPLASPSFTGSATFATASSGFDSSGNLGIGTTTPAFNIEASSNSASIISATLYSSTAGSFGNFIGRKARGTAGAPTALQQGDSIANFGARGYGATGFSTASRAAMLIVAGENWTDSAQGALIQFRTTAVGGTTTSEKMRLNSNGNLLLGNTTGTSLLSVGSSAQFTVDTSGNVSTSGTINKLTLTAPATGSTLTIADGKTLTASNTLTFAGTDGSTLNIGSGGTLGSNAFTSTAYAPLASPTFTGTVTIPTPFTLGAISVTATGTQLNYLAAATGTTGTTSSNVVFSASPTFTGTVTIPSPFTLGAVSVTTTGTQLNYLASATGTTGTTNTNIVFSASPTFTGTVTIPTPFTLGATSVTTTGDQLNYLNAATGTTGTTNTNIVFSASPTFTGTVTAPLVNGGSASNSSLTLQSTSGTGTSDSIIFKTASQSTSMTLSSAGNIGLGRNTVSNVRFAAATASTGQSIMDLYETTTRRFRLIFATDVELQADGAIPMAFYTNSTQRLLLPAAGGAVVGNAALSTSATDGFLYIPTCAGAPTGVPTTQTGTAATVYDTSNNKLYVYNGAWKSVTLA